MQTVAWLKPAGYTENSRDDVITDQQKREMIARGGIQAALADNYYIPWVRLP